MSQTFGPYANTIVRIVLISLVVLPFAGIGLAYAVMWSPYITREHVTRRQPVPFSHQHHVGQLGLDCRYCHSSVEKSAFAGLPPTKTCMTCHSQLFTEAPMLAPVRESLAQGKPIRWQKVYALPDYVYFDHSVHVANGVGCTTCHGSIDKMPLTQKAAPLTMAWCLECHRNPAAHLRPPGEIFSTSWKKPADQLEEGRRLLTEYHIQSEHLTDCSICHR